MPIEEGALRSCRDGQKPSRDGSFNQRREQVRSESYDDGIGLLPPRKDRSLPCWSAALGVQVRRWQSDRSRRATAATRPKASVSSIPRKGESICTGCCDESRATRRQHSDDLLNCFAHISHMLKNLDADDEVEGRAGLGNLHRTLSGVSA